MEECELAISLVIRMARAFLPNGYKRPAMRAGRLTLSFLPSHHFPEIPLTQAFQAYSYLALYICISYNKSSITSGQHGCNYVSSPGWLCQTTEDVANRNAIEDFKHIQLPCL